MEPQADPGISSADGIGVLTDQRLGKLLTLGYGKLKGSEDLATLIEGQGITHLLDVRFNPTGWKALWRRPAVKMTVEQAGPAYEHRQDLGNPDFKSGKPAYRFFNEETGMARVSELLEAGENVALMCVCADTPHCHRRLIVAKAREKYPTLRVVELEVGKEPVES